MSLKMVYKVSRNRFPQYFLSVALLLISIFISVSANETKNLQVYHRSATSLNGDWNYIVDPYENGFYNYRLDVFDQMENPLSGGYYADKKMECGSSPS